MAQTMVVHLIISGCTKMMIKCMQLCRLPHVILLHADGRIRQIPAAPILVERIRARLRHAGTITLGCRFTKGSMVDSTVRNRCLSESVTGSAS
jgi:hypothetical protein